MQDPLEIRISELPLRRTPRHWKNAILKQAAAAPARREFSLNQLAFAAAWTLIGLLQWQAAEPTSPSTGTLPVLIYVPHLSALRNSEAVLEELLAEPAALPPIPKQSRHNPTPPVAIA